MVQINRNDEGWSLRGIIGKVTLRAEEALPNNKRNRNIFFFLEDKWPISK